MSAPDQCPNTGEPIDLCECAECLEIDVIGSELDYYSEVDA